MESTPSSIVGGLYLQRRERNAAYSLTAFARDIGVSVSLLSRIMNGSRPVSLKLALQISTSLELSQVTHKKLVASVLEASTKTSKISTRLRQQLKKEVTSVQATTLDVELFQSMAQWYHLAILNLARLDDFHPDPKDVSKRLGITTFEAKSALERLIHLGLLKQQKTRLTRTSKSLFIPTKNSHVAVRKFHTQMIEKALRALEETSPSSFSRRSISAVTLTCSAAHLEVIKEKIETFQKDVISYIESSSSDSDSVFQLNTQFFPLTKDLP